VPAAAETVPDDPRDAVAAVVGQDDQRLDRAKSPEAGADSDPAATASAGAPIDEGAAPPRKGPEPSRRPARRQGAGGPPSTPAPAPPSRPASPPPPPTPAAGAKVGESDKPRSEPPASQPRPRAAPPPPPSQPRPRAAPPPPAPERTTQPGTQPPDAPAPQAAQAAETKPRPGSGPLGVPPDAPEARLAAEEAAEAPPGPTPGTPARPPGGTPPSASEGEPATADEAPDRRSRGRRARSLLRFTAPRRPEHTEREASSSDAATPLADFDRLTQSIESVTEALGGQPLEFYERDLPQIAAAETARRVRADVVVLLLDNGEGLMEVSGGVGLTPAERRLNVEYSRDVMRELFRAGVGLIEDTDRVRGALAGIPGSRAETLVMVPLVHERLGFGVLMAGRNRSQTGVPTEVFTDAEIEVLMGFADAAAASLRTAVLLRHLKGQLRALEDEG
jgi:hypothetical protein